jgi:hypothetical protein
MLYGGVSWKHTPPQPTFSHSPNRASVASSASPSRRGLSVHARSAPLKSERAPLRASQICEKIVPTSLLFSIPSTGFQKSAQSSENKRFQIPFSSYSSALFPWKPFAFYSLHFYRGGIYTPRPTSELILYFNFAGAAAVSLARSVNYDSPRKESRRIGFLPLCESLRPLCLCVSAFLLCRRPLAPSDETLLSPPHQYLMRAHT